jgi:inosine-uridine nucleoside N-ribohydrolase
MINMQPNHQVFGFENSAFFRHLAFAIWIFAIPLSAAESTTTNHAPVKIIFDTDIGNDVDDVLALSVLHALQTRGECELLAVTVTRADELAGPFVDAMNTFYGRPEIPIGCIKGPLAKEPSKFLRLAELPDGGQLRYPHKLQHSSDAPAPATLLRKILAQQSDHSVIMVQVGFFSNLAALLDTAADANSPLDGHELVKQKVKLLSVMAGAFRTNAQNPHPLEFNVIKDIPSAQKLARNWPTPIVWSGFEIGVAVPYPAVSIERDFAYVPHHPAAEAYRLYNPPPHERPCWDLTSALYAVLPDRGYFGLSAPGKVSVESDGFTRFTLETDGRDRFLTLNELQITRVKEALVQLASQPPSHIPQ